MAGFSCRGRRSGLFALSFLCHAWSAYESLPVNVLPSLHHGPTTRFSSFVRWFYRAIVFKVYRGRVPSKSKRLDAIRGTSNWPGLNENDPATLMALPLLPTPGQWRPPCCPFVHGNKIPGGRFAIIVQSRDCTRISGPIRETDGRYLQMIELGN